MAEVESVLSKLLLSLQFCLAFWQIVKLTAFGAIIKAILSWCLSKLPCGLGARLSPSYARLRGLDSLGLLFEDRRKGLVFKGARLFFAKVGVCVAIKEGDQPSVANQASDKRNVIQIRYLGEEFKIERKERYKLFVNDKMTYYITDPIWQSLLNFTTLNCEQTVLKGHRVLFGAVVTGGVMELAEVLDGLILRNEIIKPLFRGAAYYCIPINLSVSEEKLLKGLNLVGLFLQAKKQVYWLIPILLSLISAVMEFCTALRVLIYSNVNRIFCWAMRPLCDCLPLGARVSIYTLFDSLLDNFKPSHDFQWREVSGVKSVVIAGGAKGYSDQNASLVPPPSTSTPWKKLPYSKEFPFKGEYPFRVELELSATLKGRVQVSVRFKRYEDTFVEDCEEEQYKRLCTFIEKLMETGSGSLESCREAKGRVCCRVRGIEESIFCYIRNGFPDVYILDLKNATIK